MQKAGEGGFDGASTLTKRNGGRGEALPGLYQREGRTLKLL